MRQRLRTASLLMLLVLVLAACAAPQPEPEPQESREPWETAEIFLSYATVQKGERETSSELTKQLLTASEGRIYCNAYPGGKLGSDAQLMQALQNGTISIVQCATSVQVEQIPQLALLDTPYLFRDRESCDKCLNERLLDFFQPYYNEAGLQLIAWHCPGFRQVTSSVEISTAQDLRQVRMRTMENEYHQLYWSALGAETVPMDFSDLFYALQQGAVNAQENTISASVTAKLNQMQDYLILTNHLPFINSMVMNKDAYDNLSPQDQELLAQVVLEYITTGAVVLAEEEPERYFTHVITPAQEQLVQLEQGAQAVREALARDLGGDVADAFYALTDSLC